MRKQHLQFLARLQLLQSNNSRSFREDETFLTADPAIPVGGKFDSQAAEVLREQKDGR